MSQSKIRDYSLAPETDRQAANERLARLRTVLAANDIGAAVYFDAVNIRYATGVRNMQINTTRNPGRYVFVPVEGPVTLFEYTGCGHLADGYDTVDEIRTAKGLHPFYGGQYYKQHLAAFVEDMKKLMRRAGVEGQRLGIERSPIEAVPALMAAGIEIVDASISLDIAKSIKTPTEMQLVRASVACTEAAVAYMEERLVPGRSENEVFADLSQALLAGGGEYLETRLFNSGSHTNPWFQETGNKIIQAGELVALDTDAISVHGYYTDMSRTFLAGDGEATAAQKHVYGLAYEQLQHNLDLIRPGVSFREFSNATWPIPAEYFDNRYICVVHGNGMTGEHPAIPYPDVFDICGIDGEFEPNMTVCVESYIGSCNGGEGVKLEEQVLITETGIERLTTYPFESRLMN